MPELSNSDILLTIYYEQVLRKAESLYDEGGESLGAGLELFDEEFGGIEQGQKNAEILAGENPESRELCLAYALNGVGLLQLRQSTVERIRWLRAAEKLLDDSDTETDEHLLNARMGVLSNLGLAYADLGEPLQAIDFHRRHLSLASSQNNLLSQGTALTNLGSAYQEANERRKAIESFREALKIYRKIKDSKSSGRILSNLASVYIDLGEPEKARRLYEQHLADARKSGDRLAEGVSWGGLGIALSMLGGDAPEEVYECHKKQLFIARELKDQREIANALGNLSLAYLDNPNQSKQALDNALESLKIADELADDRLKANALGRLGTVYSYAGEYKKAVKYHTRHLKLAAKVGDRRGESLAYANLAILYTRTGQMQKAAYYYRRYLKLARLSNRSQLV